MFLLVADPAGNLCEVGRFADHGAPVESLRLGLGLAGIAEAAAQGDTGEALPGIERQALARGGVAGAEEDQAGLHEIDVVVDGEIREERDEIVLHVRAVEAGQSRPAALRLEGTHTLPNTSRCSTSVRWAWANSVSRMVWEISQPVLRPRFRPASTSSCSQSRPARKSR